MKLKQKPLLFDGAMGTYYANSAENPLPKCELANIYDQKTIVNIHKAYIEAGCLAIRTNTFGANKVYLEADFKKVKEVITKGYEAALEATMSTDVLVFADIGPIPFQEETHMMEDYKEIVDVFLELGAAYFIFETFSDAACLIEVACYIKDKNPEAFILTEFAVSPEGFTRLGVSGSQLIKKMTNGSTVDAVGFNCFSGPYHLLEYIQAFKMADHTFSIMPNSGYPTIINNRVFYEDTKEYFAAKVLEMVNKGVSIIGGCCGTTPEYIKEINSKIRELSPNNANDVIDEAAKNGHQIKVTVAKNTLFEKMDAGKKIIAVELDPPVNTEIDFFMESAAALKEQGVDAITIADCPIARARVDSSLLACKLKRELRITAIPHMTCRDRNINATKALLLGLNIEGIHNVLVVTGDPIPQPQRDEVSGIFQFNSKILANYIRSLNETVFSSPFNICGALNLNARNFSSQLSHAKKKIENGMTMFLTQPILTKEAFENLKRARSELKAKILGGIIPVVSYKNACFMNNEIAGINVSENIIELYRDISKEEAGRLALQISGHVAEAISPYVDGYYLITPFKRIDLITEIIKGIKEQSTRAGYSKFNEADFLNF